MEKGVIEKEQNRAKDQQRGYSFLAEIPVYDCAGLDRDLSLFYQRGM